MNVALNSNVTAQFAKPNLTSAPTETKTSGSSSVTTSNNALAGSRGSISTDTVEFSTRALSEQAAVNTGGPLLRPDALSTLAPDSGSLAPRALAPAFDGEVLPAPQAPALDPAESVTDIAKGRTPKQDRELSNDAPHRDFVIPRFSGKAGEYGEWYVRMKARIAAMKAGPQQRTIENSATASESPALTDVRKSIGDVQAKPSVFDEASTRLDAQTIASFAANATKFAGFTANDSSLSASLVTPSINDLLNSAAPQSTNVVNSENQESASLNAADERPSIVANFRTQTFANFLAPQVNLVG